MGETGRDRRVQGVGECEETGGGDLTRVAQGSLSDEMSREQEPERSEGVSHMLSLSEEHAR